MPVYLSPSWRCSMVNGICSVVLQSLDRSHQRNAALGLAATPPSFNPGRKQDGVPGSTEPRNGSYLVAVKLWLIVRRRCRVDGDCTPVSCRSAAKCCSWVGECDSRCLAAFRSRSAASRCPQIDGDSAWGPPVALSRSAARRYSLVHGGSECPGDRSSS